MKKLNFEQVKTEYNDIMFAYCWEHCTVDTKYSENTEGWNLRDRVSEVQYHLDTCYEEGNAESEGRHPEYWKIDSSCILSKEKYDYVTRHNEQEKKSHEEWLKKTRRLRSFVRKYEKHIEEIQCIEGHCSCFD